MLRCFRRSSEVLFFLVFSCSFIAHSSQHKSIHPRPVVHFVHLFLVSVLVVEVWSLVSYFFSTSLLIWNWKNRYTWIGMWIVTRRISWILWSSSIIASQRSVGPSEKRWQQCLFLVKGVLNKLCSSVLYRRVLGKRNYTFFGFLTSESFLAFVIFLLACWGSVSPAFFLKAWLKPAQARQLGSGRNTGKGV